MLLVALLALGFAVSAYAGVRFDEHPYLPWLLAAVGMALAGLLALYVFSRRLEARVAQKTSEALAAHDTLAVEREASMALLSSSEARFRGLFENMTEAFALHEAVLDENGQMADYRWLLVNPAFVRVTGLKAEDITGKSQREVMPGEDPFWTGVYAKVVETGEAAHIEHYSPELKRHFRVYAYRNAPGQFVALFSDVTAQRVLELQLQQAQKMEALGALAGGIAHDFNNILGAILGYAELSVPLAKNNPELVENIGEIANAGIRARDLTRQILAFSRKSEETPRPVDVTLIAKEALKLLRSTVPSTIRLTIELPKPAAPCVLATPVQLHQVVMNLGTNAYHALREIGGSVRFSVDAVAVGEAEAGRLGVAAGRFTRLTVADDGPGIAPEVLPRIFEPFFTTKATGEGTGLGLAAVLSIARGCGGAVTVDSAPGEGARFSVFFPAAVAEETPEPKADAGVAPLSGSVLVVDDETTLAKLLVKILSRRGLKAEWRVSAEEALAQMVEDPGRWDVVVTDQTMPGLTGAQFLERARGAGLMQPFVVCTGFSDVLDADEALQRGFSAYLKKPVRQEELVDAIVATL